MNVLSFSIFDNTNDWQFLFYIRGLFFNCAMAKIVYPDFKIHITAERSIYLKYSELFQSLVNEYGVIIDVRDEEALCKMMLWRLAPIFALKDAEYVFCRDSDSLVTNREASATDIFMRCRYVIHGLHDNPAHSVPLLGGLCGFKCDPIRDKYGSYYSMIHQSPVQINKRGSDQDFLTHVIYRDFMCASLLANVPESNKQNPLWLSDLCIAFAGAAGCNEFETLRYLKSQGIDLTLNGIGKKYPEIFYWT